MFVFIISRDWRNIYVNDLASFKAKLARDGFDLQNDRFFIVSANKRYLGEKEINEQFAVFYLPCRQIFLPIFLKLASLIFFFKALRKKPDICYATTPFFAVSFVFCKYLLQIPVFCNVVSSVSQIISKKPGIKRKIIGKAVFCAELLGARLSDILMPNSHWLEKQLLKWGIKPEKIVFRPVKPPHIQIDPEKVEEIKRKYNLDGKKVIFTASRLEKEKNLAIILDALGKIKRNDIIWFIAGNGSQEKSLKNKAVELGIADKIIFLGRVEHSEIWNYYYTCDLFVLASLSEGMPTVILEAMLTQKPVIASAIDGNKELVEDNQSGLLFDQLSADDLARKIEIVLENTDLSVRIVQGGFSRAKYYCQKYQTISQIYTKYYGRTF